MDESQGIINLPVIRLWHKTAQHWIEVVCIYLNEKGIVQSAQDADGRIIPHTDFDLQISHE